MTSDGSPWRPIVHIDDVCTAIKCALVAQTDAIQCEVFNVGSTDENYRIREIAEIVNEAFPDCVVTFGDPDPDNRSYRVSFEKIANGLPGFRCQWTARDGALQLRKLFERISMPASTFEAPPFTRMKCLSELVSSRQIDDDFYWVAT